jgi:predicted RNase H-like nuclease (RuvC/YqgF family)
MGNQIKFTPKDKETPVTTLDSEMELENIQLKNTNRKLISKLEQQKQLNKKLEKELVIFRKSMEQNNLDKLKNEYQALKNKNKNLETLLSQSRKDIDKLKREIEKLSKDSSNLKEQSTWNKLRNIRK